MPNRRHAGIFYFNPDDPAVWVPKRFGIGYTLNFARPAAWIVLAAVIGMIAGPIALAMGTLLSLLSLVR